MDAALLAEAIPWYERMIDKVGPLAATLLIFFVALGVFAWYYGGKVLAVWTDERVAHRAALADMDIRRKDETAMLVEKIEQREIFIRTELIAIIKSIEKRDTETITEAARMAAMAAAKEAAVAAVHEVMGIANHEKPG